MRIALILIIRYSTKLMTSSLLLTTNHICRFQIKMGEVFVAVS